MSKEARKTIAMIKAGILPPLKTVGVKKRSLDEQVLRGRLQHLLESEFIRSFDEIDPATHKYKRDIKEADEAAEAVAISKDLKIIIRALREAHNERNN